MKGVLFVFDIETRGKSMIKNGILSVGVVVGDENGEILHTQQWNVDELGGQEFEQRCLDEFWNKQPKELLESFSKNTVPAVLFAQEFRCLLNKFDNAYILSDNPTFDAGYINYYLDYYGFDSMQFKSDGKSYRVVHDSDSYACGAVHAPISYTWPSDKDIQKLIGFTVENKELELIPHNPVHDAMKIYFQFIALVKNVAQNEKLFYSKLE
jgi:hypothetical protein